MTAWENLKASVENYKKGLIDEETICEALFIFTENAEGDDVMKLIEAILAYKE